MIKYLSETLANLGFTLISSPRFEGRHLLTKEQADELYTSYKSKFIIIDGLRIHYRDEGMGTPIVLLHGFAASLHLWNDWVDELSKKYRVVTIDLPGFGLSDSPPKGKIDVLHYLGYIRELLLDLNITNCHMVGNSFGGWLTWEFALAYPKLIDKIVLISAAGYFTENTKPKTVELASKPFFLRILKTGVPRFVVKRILGNSYGDKKKITEYEVNRYYGLINREGNLMSLFKIASQNVNLDVKRIKKIKNNTLIMWGTLDAIIPITDGFKFNKDIKKSKLVVYKGVGHIPQVEVAQKSLIDLKKFLKP